MYLLKGGKVVSGESVKRQDVLLDGEIIREVGEELVCPGAEVISAEGKYLFPGFIDAHTHFDLEVSGTVTADNFSTGTQAALAGGTTMILDFATQYKGESLKTALDHWHKKASGNCSCDYGFHLAISQWNQEVSKELEEIVREGVTSFKLYMIYDDMAVRDGEIYQVLKRTRELGALVGVHCENKDLVQELCGELKKNGETAPGAHPKSRPACVEAEAVNRLLAIAGLAHSPVMVVHLSTAEGYEQIQAARARGQKVYAETCPQYLLLEESRYQLEGFRGAGYVCSPPLRKAMDQKCLWEAVSQDEIQTMSTDHCSFSMAQKEMGRDDFTKIPNGMPGVQHRPVLLYTYGVMENRITLEQMCRLLSENPAKLYGVFPRKGTISKGSHGDIVVWDPCKKWVITAKNQLYHMDYAPFEGFSVTGQAEKVFLRGKLVYQHGKFMEKNTGCYIRRQPGML